MEIFGCVLEALDVGEDVSLSLPLNVKDCMCRAVSTDLLNAQSREGIHVFVLHQDF